MNPEQMPGQENIEHIQTPEEKIEAFTEIAELFAEESVKNHSEEL